MTLATGKIQMAKLARLRHRQAELVAQFAESLAEEAKIFDQLAGGQSVDLRTGKRRAKFREVELSKNITPEDSAAAIDALRNNEMRRRGR